MTDRSELKTDRLLLRPFRVEDVDDVFGYARHPEWTRYLPGIPQPYGRRHAEEFVAKSILASWESFTPFAIVLEGTVIGATNLSIDTVNETASLGYALAKEHWGKGLALEAAQAVVGWGFRRARTGEGLVDGGPAQQTVVAGYGEAGDDQRGPDAQPSSVPRRAYRRGLLRHPPRRVAGSVAQNP